MTGKRLRFGIAAAFALLTLAACGRKTEQSASFLPQTESETVEEAPFVPPEPILIPGLSDPPKQVTGIEPEPNAALPTDQPADKPVEKAGNASPKPVEVQTETVPEPIRPAVNPETAVSPKEPETVVPITPSDTPVGEPTRETGALPDETPAEEPQNKAGSEQKTYVLNVSSKKFHLPSCGSANDMKAENRAERTCSRDELIAEGYAPCKRCNP